MPTSLCLTPCKHFQDIVSIFRDGLEVSRTPPRCLLDKAHGRFCTITSCVAFEPKEEEEN